MLTNITSPWRLKKNWYAFVMKERTGKKTFFESKTHFGHATSFLASNSLITKAYPFCLPLWISYTGNVSESINEPSVSLSFSASGPAARRYSYWQLSLYPRTLNCGHVCGNVWGHGVQYLHTVLLICVVNVGRQSNQHRLLPH